MPSSVSELFAAAGLTRSDVVPWGTRVPEIGPGVYAVALATDPVATAPTLEHCPVSREATERLLATRDELQLDGERPGEEALAARIAGFWLPDEVIIYIGLAGTSLANRVGQYYRTPLGARKPHAGGWFLKLLADIDSLYVHYAKCDDPDETESKMLASFVAGVSERTKNGLVDPEHPFPFANLEWPRGTRKLHGITGAKGDGQLTERTSFALGEWEPRDSQSPSRHEPSEDLRLNDFIQRQLRLRGEDSVTAIEAAGWLDGAGVLKDSTHRPGLPLRELLRGNRIFGQRQESNGRWFIDRAKDEE